MATVLLLALLLGAYYYGVRTGYNAGLNKGYERGQDDTVARLIV